MGRELKRVPIDFDWPINERWKGYINPHYTAAECAICDGTGESITARGLSDQWYGRAPFKPEDRGSKPFTTKSPAVRSFAERQVLQSPGFYGAGEAAIELNARRLCGLINRKWSHHLNDDDVQALVKAGRLMDFTHTFTPSVGWAPKEPVTIPTTEEVNAWSIGGFGHDSINKWVVIKAECERLGCSEACALCLGEGNIWPSEADKARYEAWEREEPPTGDGYQIWETVSEGSPISPPFSTAEDLARHMATTRWGGDSGTPYETWLSFINGPGWAPSMVIDSNGVHDGVSAAVGAATREIT